MARGRAGAIEKAGAKAATTIADVARVAGVSIATVSRALTTPAVVTGPTRERVLKAVGRTGYQPNAAARMLRSRKSRMVMVVVPDIANPFFPEVLRGIDETLSASGYGIIIANLDGASAKDAQYVELAASGQVDGAILLCGRVLSAALDIPHVAACEIIPRAAIPQVDVTNREAMKAATQHLLDLGHRRFGYLSGPPRNILDRERRAGWQAALREAGLAPTDTVLFVGDFTFASGTRAAQHLLAMPPATRPTAMLAANDEMAIGLMTHVTQSRLSVPGDLSIIGFDAIAFSDYCQPPLTTVRQPRAEIGATAARLLLACMAGETSGVQPRIRLAAELVVRGTTAPPADQRRRRQVADSKLMRAALEHSP